MQLVQRPVLLEQHPEQESQDEGEDDNSENDHAGSFLSAIR